jgi:hypothetical protein
MNNAKFTQGPWKYDPAAEAVTSGDLIVIVYEMNTNEADGHLIAAAPDMYEALKEIGRILESDNCETIDPTISAAEELVSKALAKAEGK